MGPLEMQHALRPRIFSFYYPNHNDTQRMEIEVLAEYRAFYRHEQEKKYLSLTGLTQKMHDKNDAF